jgi:hypothetical protein
VVQTYFLRPVPGNNRSGPPQILYPVAVKLHELTRDCEDHSFANIHHAVSGSFQVMGYPEQVAGSINQLGVVDNMGGQIPVDPAISEQAFTARVWSQTIPDQNLTICSGNPNYKPKKFGSS